MKNLWRTSRGVLSARTLNLLLVLLGVASLAFYRVGLRAKEIEDISWFIKLGLVQSALYLIAAWAVWRGRASRSTFFLILAFAAFFRLSVLFAPPYLSTDIYRYVWDGRVQAAGVNPYRYIPADEALSGLRDEAIYPLINRSDYAPTIYPPVAEAVFFLTTRVSESVTWMKATMVGFETITVCALVLLLNSYGLPRQRVIIYAWHPLLIWEIAGTGHLDAIATAFLALALLARRSERDALTGLLLACATLVKFFPAVLFPALYRRRDWRMPLAFVLTIVASYLPYLGVGLKGVIGFLPGYAEEEGIENGERFYLLMLARRAFSGVEIPTAAYFVFALGVLFALACWCVFRREPVADTYIRRAALLATAFTMLHSPRFPWYLSWLVPFVCLWPYLPVLYLTAAGFVLNYLWLGEETDRRLIINSAFYGPAALLALAMYYRSRGQRRQEPASDHSVKSLKEDVP
ncbi:MAG: glycosyltransferase 87 family protein [Acidobacteria bacterium]|nr:glycosyltransferase 87 family protein [Acidobacteriota bacterium]